LLHFLFFPSCFICTCLFSLCTLAYSQMFYFQSCIYSNFALPYILTHSNLLHLYSNFATTSIMSLIL
jgi:hypothetical protein